MTKPTWEKQTKQSKKEYKHISKVIHKAFKEAQGMNFGDEIKKHNKPNRKSKPTWEKKFRLEMAGIIGKEGKFAMNSMVKLASNLLSAQRTTLIKRLKQTKWKTPPKYIRLTDLGKVKHKTHNETVSEAIAIIEGGA